MLTSLLMSLMTMRLRFNPYDKVLARLAHSMDKTILSIRPLTDEISLDIVLGETVFRNFVVEECGQRSAESEGSRRERAFDLRELRGAGAVGVVVYCGLEDYFIDF